MVIKFFGIVRNGEDVFLLTQDGDSDTTKLLSKLENFGIVADKVPPDIAEGLKKELNMDLVLR